MADAVLATPAPGQSAAGGSGLPLDGGDGAKPATAPGVQRMCAACAEEEKPAEVRRSATAADAGADGRMAPSSVEETLSSGAGRALDTATRDWFEPRFGHDFGAVRVHTDAQAAASSRSVNAVAYTVGNDIAFGAGAYAPHSTDGRRLLAHELSHVVQQTGGAPRPDASGASPEASAQLARRVGPTVQRALGDGHDLKSPRFSKLLDLEDVYDGTTTLGPGSSGRGVQAVQQSLRDIGFSLPTEGADGHFGQETANALLAYQKANSIRPADATINAATMDALDRRFPTVALPATSTSQWTSTCVLQMLCPWTPHTVDLLRTRVALKSFDDIHWDDETWDGSKWTVTPFRGGGYNTGTEIGMLHNKTCEKVVSTLYHEVLHAEQPSHHTTTLQSESYAYRIGEEFDIAMGIPGHNTVRSTDAQGREFADPTKVNAFVAAKYPSVPAGGGGEEIESKVGSSGDVQVKRADGSTYVRRAAVGEKVPGPRVVVNERVQNTKTWNCP
jgi:hypothetical protein